MTADEFTFGQFRLCLRKHEVYRDGVPVRLRGRAFEILCVLASAKGEIVTKDELLARVWGGVIVEENAIQVHVSALRKALGEGANGQSVIVTVSGRGYRLLALSPSTATVSAHQQNDALLASHSRPSIAVMAFSNLSSSAEQDYFADGIAEDITTALSRLRWLFVIARNSSFTYKGQSVDVRRVGHELGVRYVLEGSIRKSGDRIRLTAQLIETDTGTHIWADRYDRALGDIFALQDELTQSIVAAIEPNVRGAEIARARGKPTQDLGAYDLYLRALPQLYAATRGGHLEAEKLLRRAIALDPNYSDALALLADCVERCVQNGWTEGAPALRDARDLARRAVVADQDNGLALAVSSYMEAHVPLHDEAIDLAGHALRCHPNSTYVRALCGTVFALSGEIDEALEHLEAALHINPRDPRAHLTMMGFSLANFFARQFEEAARWGKRALIAAPSLNVSRRVMAAALGHLDRIEDARAEISELLAAQPNSCLARSRRTKAFRFEWMLDLYVDGLRRAGLPENPR